MPTRDSLGESVSSQSFFEYISLEINLTLSPSTGSWTKVVSSVLGDPGSKLVGRKRDGLESIMNAGQIGYEAV